MAWHDLVESSTASGPLTREMLERTFEAMSRPRPPHRHIISSTAAKKPGTWTMCHDCGSPVKVPG